MARRWNIPKAVLIAAFICVSVDTTKAQPTPPPVKIGVLTDMSGMYRDIMGPGSIVAAQLAVDDFGGTVLGRRVEIVAADHQAKPDIGSTIARTWFDTQDVSAIVDVAQSAVALAVQEVARQRHKIVRYGVVGSPSITQEACAPTTFSWSLNAYAINAPLPGPLIKRGLDTFFFITVDYSFGHAMAAEAARAIKTAGGKIVGSVLFPQHSEDFSSFLVQAQVSKAKVIYLISAAEDTTVALKQAREFVIEAGGQRIVTPLTYITNVHVLGLEDVQGSTFLTPFYWDRTPETRAFAARFAKERASMPTMDHGAVYSATLHYLQAVADAKTLDGPTVADRIRKLPVRDFYVPNGRVRADGWLAGWLMHDFYLVQVKTPQESHYPWDYYKVLDTISADATAQPIAESKCPLLNNKTDK